MASQPLSTHSSTPQPYPVLQTFFEMPVVADLIACFQSVHLAIVLLILLAIGVYLGVYFPQEGTVDPAEVQKYWGLQYGFAKAVGLNQVFSSFWFLTLEGLFFFNLLIGSFKWLKPATLAALQKTFLPASWLGQKLEAFSIASPFEQQQQSKVFEQTQKTLKQLGYKTYTEDDKVYACKGNLTRLGPALAHIGILLCLIAGFQSYLYGYKALQGAVPGQVFTPNHAEQIVTNSPKGIWQGKLPDWGVRVDDFKIDYYPVQPGKPKTPKQYYSTLSILNPVDGTNSSSSPVVKHETISVNHPLNYADTSIYQASFAPSGRFNAEINEKATVLTLNDQFNQRQVSVTRLPQHRLLVMFPFMAGQDPGVEKDFAMFFVRGGKEDVAGDGRMPPNTRLMPGQQGVISGLKIKFLGPEMATGLQIKYAPEVPLMYASYFIIMLGAALCFFSQRQLWIALQPIEGSTQKTLVIYPKTNKARFSFKQEVEKIQLQLNNLIIHQNAGAKPEGLNV